MALEPVLPYMEIQLRRTSLPIMKPGMILISYLKPFVGNIPIIVYAEYPIDTTLYRSDYH